MLNGSYWLNPDWIKKFEETLQRQVIHPDIPLVREGFVPVLTEDDQDSGSGGGQITNDSSYKLCGTPGLCKLSAAEKCTNISLDHCSECSHVVFGFYVFIILILGLAIVSGNLLILKVYYDLKKKCKERKVDIYKASLAIADLIAGLLIFFVAFPNFSWTIKLSLDHITTEVVLLRNTPQSIIGSFFYLLGYTASLYHLLLLGIMRLYAIRWPQRYNQLSSRSSYIGIGIAWSLAIIMATIPSWFPSYYSFDYSPVVFFYIPSLNYNPSSTPSESVSAILSLTLILLIPFILITSCTLTTAIVVRQAIRSSQKRLKSKETSSQARFSKREISAFKTVAIMQIGFTLTLVPIGIVVALLYAGNLQCDGFSNVYFVCFYLSRSNSLVNMIVYSVREPNFRSSVKKNFCKSRSSSSSASSSNTKIHFLISHSKNSKSKVSCKNE